MQVGATGSRAMLEVDSSRCCSRALERPGRGAGAEPTVQPPPERGARPRRRATASAAAGAAARRRGRGRLTTRLRTRTIVPRSAPTRRAAEPSRARDLELAAAADVRDQRARRHVGERSAERGAKRPSRPSTCDVRGAGATDSAASDVMRLPKPSTWMTSPLDAIADLARPAAAPSSTMLGERAAPRSAGDAPAASRPAVGAKTSRPWNVGLTGSRRKRGVLDAVDLARPGAPPATARRCRARRRSAARRDHQVGARAADAGVDDRDVDRAGGNSGAACASAIAPAATSCGGDRRG